MDSYVNAVYDNWVDGIPQPNLEKELGENRFRTVSHLFSFFEMTDILKNVRLEDVYNNPKEKYFYFINSVSDFESYFLDGKLPISDTIEKCLYDNDNFNIVFLNEHEYEGESFFVKLIDILNKRGYNHKRFYVINNNSKLREYKEKYSSEINTHSLNYLVKIKANETYSNPCKLVLDKEGFAMMHNRTVKPHRYGLLVKLKKEKLLNEIDWSLVLGWERKKMVNDIGSDNNFYLNVMTPLDVEDLKSEIKWIEQIELKKSNYEQNRKWFDSMDYSVDPNAIFEPETYENSYVNITTESCFLQKEIHITDKSIKPLSFYQIPIFVASYNHVKYIREKYDLDVFDDIIDHSYDEEEDNIKRFDMIFNEIKRVFQNKEKIKNFYKENTNRLIKNRETILNLIRTRIDEDYFLSIIK